MPTLRVVKASNASFSPSYSPVAIFIGGTSGVGQAMAEAFARYVHGHAHIIIVGRNEHAAAEIIARFPKPDAVDVEWTHEFVPCDVSLMSNVRTTCAEIRAKFSRVNHLVMTAGYSSLVSVALTDEGLDLHLAIRYYQRFVFIQELLPLLQHAQALGQDARVMSVLGAGLGSPSRPLDLANLGNTVKPRDGRFSVAMRSIVMSSGYTDAMLAHFASQNPAIAFTHIHPGVVRTPGMRSATDFDGILAPLGWILSWILPLFAVSQDVCAEHMLHALFTGERGLFIRNRYGDVVSAHEFDEVTQLGDNENTSVLAGTPMQGYGASDRGVRAVFNHSVAATAPAAA